MRSTSPPKARWAGRRCAPRGGWAFPSRPASTPASTTTCATTAPASSRRGCSPGCAASTTAPTRPWCRRANCRNTCRQQGFRNVQRLRARGRHAPVPSRLARRRAARAVGPGRRRTRGAPRRPHRRRRRTCELAVRAFRALQAQRPDARFVWVGDGPARAELQHAQPRLRLLPACSAATTLARHFASADLFVFPSLTETFGNVTLEAMASGVPTVAFDYGAAREHLRDGEHGAAIADRRRRRLRRRGRCAARRATRPARGWATRRAPAVQQPASRTQVAARLRGRCSARLAARRREAA